MSTEPTTATAETGHRIHLELVDNGPVFVRGDLVTGSGRRHPITLPPEDWAALETVLAEAARYPVPAVATDLHDMVTEALRPHLRLVEDQDECWEVTVEGASGLADVAIEALISAARLPGVADEHVMFEYRLARDQVTRFAERVNAVQPVVEVARIALKEAIQLAIAIQGNVAEIMAGSANSASHKTRAYGGLTRLADHLRAAVDALDGAS